MGYRLLACIAMALFHYENFHIHTARYLFRGIVTKIPAILYEIIVYPTH